MHSGLFCLRVWLNINHMLFESNYFPDPSGIFALGCYKDSLIGSDKFNSAVLAVRIDARGCGT